MVSVSPWDAFCGVLGNRRSRMSGLRCFGEHSEGVLGFWGRGLWMVSGQRVLWEEPQGHTPLQDLPGRRGDAESSPGGWLGARSGLGCGGVQGGAGFGVGVRQGARFGLGARQGGGAVAGGQEGLRVVVGDAAGGAGR